MGQYFLIVNPAKRQYIDAGCFNENVKPGGFLRGNHAIALALLVCSASEVDHNYGPLAGSWCGDPVIAAGSYAEPDLYGIKTSTEDDPEQNLYGMAGEEFEDISYKVIASLCEGREGFSEEIVQQSLGSYAVESALVEFGNVVFQVGCEPLKQALAKAFGEDWVEKYEDAKRERS